MRFGPIPVVEAEGAILAHSLRLAEGTLKKGRRLGSEDCERLAAAGLGEVVAAVLEPDDVHEDAAAEAVARAVAGCGLRVAAPFTGRCNLFAVGAGLLRVDAGLVHAINRVDEAITVATLGPWTPVSEGQMVATIKIIPFAVPGARLEEALSAAGRQPALSRVSFQGRPVGLVQTTLPGVRDSVLEKTRGILDARITALGSRLLEERRCPHDEAAVAEAITALLLAGAGLVLVVGASAIVDRRDVIPAAVARAGGEIIHFGMPMDPGNLLLLARHGEVPVLGLPGCARSPAYNGLDPILERLAAGLEVGAAEVIALGVGGLLKEVAERPQPRRGTAPARAPVRAPQVAALVLAAGRSRRMGGANKLLAPVRGRPMVRRVVEAALGSSACGVWVVTGHQREAVESVLQDLPIQRVHNPRFAEGLSTSLSAGLAALPAQIEGAVVCLGDMPLVDARVLDRLIAAFDPPEGRSICLPTWEGKRGNPVLFARRHFDEMTLVRGDVGARHLIGEHAEEVCEVAMEDRAVLVDVDDPAALAALANGHD